MNVATVAPVPVAALMRADAMRVLVLLRPTIARFAPSAASASAAANPMPLVAPVIRICLSFTAQQSMDRGSNRVDQIAIGRGAAPKPCSFVMAAEVIALELGDELGVCIKHDL